MSNLISWDDQRTFLAVLEEGSLSAAARRLGVSQPTVRGRIAALENALGTVLFTRSVNGLTPTSSALALREPARTMAMASDLFVRHASASLGEVAGTVRISVPEFMGIEVVPQMLRDLHDMHPDLHVEMSLSNAPADVLGQEVDIAIRMMEPAQNALIAKKVATIPLGFFASHEYVNRRGAPKTMADLASHELIGPDRSRADLEFTNRLAPDFPLERFVLRTDSHPAQYAAARAGLGIAVVQVSVGDATPGLVHLLPDLTVAELPTWVVTHENLRHIPRVAAVFGFLVNALSSPKQSSDLRNGYGIDEALPKAVKHYLTRISAILTRVACEPDPDALLRIRLAPDLHDTGWQFAVAIRFAARTLCPSAGLPVPDMPHEHNCATLLKFAKGVTGIIDPISGRDMTQTVTHIAGEAHLTQKPADYAAGFAFPNMLFHLSVAYTGLRHGGMKIGKADFDGLHVYTDPS